MKIRNISTSSSQLNQAHQQLGLPPVERTVDDLYMAQSLTDRTHIVIRVAVVFCSLMLLACAGLALYHLLSQGQAQAQALVVELFTSELFWAAVAIGLLAQVIDGALGMAYGVTSTTFLMASGVSPATASASVHIAEIFTTGFSGLAHAKMGNVNRSLFLRLLVPGAIGALIGVYLITQIDGKVIKPFISIYLAVMGLYIISKIFKKIRTSTTPPRHVGKLAVVGGFVDTVGGGGWGPVVTTTLLGAGQDPRTTIGSVNFAEFFLTFISAIAFTAAVGFGPWKTVVGLVVGGMFAAPFAAYLCKKLQTRTLLLIVGVLITSISVFNLVSSLR